MKCEHLGVVTEVDPTQAAMENAVLRVLRQHGPITYRDVWSRAGGQRVGAEAFRHLVESLVERGMVVRQTTNRKNSFVLRLVEKERS